MDEKDHVTSASSGEVAIHDARMCEPPALNPVRPEPYRYDEQPPLMFVGP